MKKILIIAIVALFNLQLATAQSPDAEYKLIRQEWTVNADGSLDYHYRHEVKILRNNALTAYADKGETFVVYNPDIETLTINEVYTIREDGSRVEMPQNAYVYQLPSSCTDCGRFNHLRELAMVHTGMEYNCIIVVDYTLHRNYDLVREVIPLQTDCPVAKREISVSAPADMDVRFSLQGEQYLGGNSAVEQTGTRTTYTFTNLPQAPREAYMPADIIPTLRIYNGVPMPSPAFNQDKLPEASDQAWRLMNEGKALKGITALRDYVVDNIHLNDIDPIHFAYRHATAAEVWQTGCGTATDKAVLLAAMINTVGYSASVAGEEMDQVDVQIDTLTYRIPVRDKQTISLYGKAEDEVLTFDFSRTIDATLDTLADGFFAYNIPGLVNILPVNASRLTPTRVTPLQGKPCNIKTTLTVNLPKGLKMVGKSIKKKQEAEGIGSVEVIIKQSGSKFVITRNLQLEQSLVPTSDYAAYRQLVAIWQNPETIIFKTK